MIQIVDHQELLIKRLEELETSIDEYSTQRYDINQYRPNLRHEISQKAIEINNSLDHYHDLIVKVKSQISEHNSDEYQKDSSKAQAQITNIVNNQYECLQWITETVDLLTSQFEALDFNMKNKLGL